MLEEPQLAPLALEGVFSHHFGGCQSKKRLKFNDVTAKVL